MAQPTQPTEYVAVTIERPAREVYAYASDPAHLSAWAAGLAATLEEVDGRWVADTPDGRMSVAFAPANPFGVADHVITLPGGEVVEVPMRVVPNGDGCDVVFSLRRPPTMTDDELARDRAAVQADLDTLKRLLEAR
ncbi:SRPBCC family protein [Actinotalea solisilvae]|uniref:SRPBCC family protein n=1 Tax=Actinotalea solisilvae TaxID=2072922 RepID=UPI0018F1A5D1|nr:SRPBCC family protein [Actinotalea solisilvae]